MRIEGLPGELREGNVSEEMCREQRHRGAGGEGPVNVGQGEPHRPLGDLFDGHAAERLAVRADVATVLEQLHRVDDVVRGDRLAVLPRCILADVECPDLPVGLGAKRGGEIGHDRAGLVIAREPAEREPHDVLVDVGRRDHRIEVLGNPGHAFDIRPAKGGIAGAGVAPVDDRDSADHDEQPDERDDDELVARGHLASR